MNFSGTSAMTMKFCFRCVWWPNMWRRWEWLWKMIWIVVNDFILCWKIFTLFILYSLFGYLHSLCASFFCWIFWRDIYWAVENISVIFVLSHSLKPRKNWKWREKDLIIIISVIEGFPLGFPPTLNHSNHHKNSEIHSWRLPRPDLSVTNEAFIVSNIFFCHTLHSSFWIV